MSWGLGHKWGESSLSISHPSAVIWILIQIYVPTFAYSHELWVVTKRVRLWIQVAEMSSLQWVAGLSLRDTVRSSFISEVLMGEPLLLDIEQLNNMRRFKHLTRMPPGHILVEVLIAANRRLQGRPRACWIEYIYWLTWKFPQMSCKRWGWWIGSLGFSG